MHFKSELGSSWGYGLELLETLLVLVQGSRFLQAKVKAWSRAQRSLIGFCKGQNLSGAWIARSLNSFTWQSKTFTVSFPALSLAAVYLRPLLLLSRVHSDIHADFSHSAPLSGSSLPM